MEKIDEIIRNTKHLYNEHKKISAAVIIIIVIAIIL